MQRGLHPIAFSQIPNNLRCWPVGALSLSLSLASLGADPKANVSLYRSSPPLISCFLSLTLKDWITNDHPRPTQGVLGRNRGLTSSALQASECHVLALPLEVMPPAVRCWGGSQAKPFQGPTCSNQAAVFWVIEPARMEWVRVKEHNLQPSLCLAPCLSTREQSTLAR